MNRTHNHRLRHTFAILASATLTLSALATPPTVVSTIPANGDFDVDPGLTQIRVEFDQDMNHGGHSVCGGERFPEIIGKPGWESARVFVMTVKLKPNHDYGFNINCPAANNFRNTSGEPAVYYSLNFATRGGTNNVTPETQLASYKELRRLIRDEYSYRHVRDVKWGKLFKKYRSRLCDAPSAEQFGRYAGKMLAAAKDIHISVKLGDRYFASHSRSVPPNANFKRLPDFVPGFTKRSKVVYTGRYPDGYGYILITGWNGNQAAALQSAFTALDEFADAKGLIIDVRFNSGGSEMLAQRFAGYFVDKPVAYAQHVLRDKTADGGFSPPHKRMLQPNRQHPTFGGKVAVLTGRHVMSSCEAFLLMMKTVPGCKLFGETSYGSSGNPQAHELPNGITVYLPCWKAMTADGREFEGVGIPPDIEIKTKPDDFKRTDPVIDAAREYLRSNKP